MVKDTLDPDDQATLVAIRQVATILMQTAEGTPLSAADRELLRTESSRFKSIAALQGKSPTLGERAKISAEIFEKALIIYNKASQPIRIPVRAGHLPVQTIVNPKLDQKTTFDALNDTDTGFLRFPFPIEPGRVVLFKFEASEDGDEYYLAPFADASSGQMTKTGEVLASPLEVVAAQQRFRGWLDQVGRGSMS